MPGKEIMNIDLKSSCSQLLANTFFFFLKRNFDDNFMQHVYLLTMAEEYVSIIIILNFSLKESI